MLVGLVIPKLSSGADPCSNASPAGRHSLTSTSFIAFGDSGSGSATQYRLAEQMAALQEAQNFHFALMLGDNIYPKGEVKSVRTRFELPYAELLKAGVRFYPVLGNHDDLTHGGKSEIAYFKMPHRWYSFRQGDAEFFMLDSNRSQLNERQLTWLDSALSSSYARWKIVALHHPIYSSGMHGSSWRLRIMLEPLLVKHKVALVLSGHDHDYERIGSRNGVYYFVSGGGGGAKPAKKRQSSSEVALAIPHFLLFELDSEKGWFQAINVCGRVIDSGMLAPQRDSG